MKYDYSDKKVNMFYACLFAQCKLKQKKKKFVFMYHSDPVMIDEHNVDENVFELIIQMN